MIVSDIMNKNIIFISSGDSINNALNKMRNNNVNQLVVINDKKLYGILALNKIITKNINPVTTKIDNYVLPTATISPGEAVENVPEKLLNSGLRALPVADGENIVGIISEYDLVHNIQKDAGYKVNDVMARCSCVSREDDIGKVRKIMMYENISRVPVLDDNKVVGIITAISMIDILQKGKQDFGKAPQTEKARKEPVPIDKMKVETVMKEPVFIDEHMPIKDIINVFTENDEAIIENNNGVFIISTKDIMELMISKKENMKIHITNLDEEDSFVVAKINQSISEFIQRMEKMTDVNSLIVHIDRYSKTGKRIKYSIRNRFLTPIGMFVSKETEWDLPSAVQKSLKKLSREFMKKHDKLIQQKRKKMYKGKRD